MLLEIAASFARILLKVMLKRLRHIGIIPCAFPYAKRLPSNQWIAVESEGYLGEKRDEHARIRFRSMLRPRNIFKPARLR